MSFLLWLILFVGSALALAYQRAGLRRATLLMGGLVICALGLLFGLSLTDVGWAPLLFALLGFMFICLEDAQRRRRPS